MRKPALAGVVALAAIGLSLATTEVRTEETRYQQHRVQAGISNAQISRVKAALRLTAEQERHWPAVAAVLRTMRLGSRAASLDSSSLQRLVSVATPLFMSLDDGQKRVAMRLVQSLGYGAFVAGL